MKKFFLFMIFIMLNTNIAFGSSHSYRKYYSESSSYGRDYFDDNYNGIFDSSTKIQMTNMQVDFTQDDDYYYFNIKSDIKLTLPNNRYPIFNEVTLRRYHIDYGDAYKLYPILYGNNNFTSIKYTNNYTTYYNNTITSRERYANTDNTDHVITISAPNEIFKYNYKRHVIIYSYKDNDIDEVLEDRLLKNIVIPNTDGFNTSDGNRTSYGYNLIYNNTKFTSMTHTYTTSMTYYSTFTGQSDCKIGILKSKIDDYKYYGLGNFFLLWNSDDDCQLEIDGKNDPSYTVRTSNYAGFCSAQYIDLSQHINCDHNFVMTYNNSETIHKWTCQKCMWERTENHNFIYTYDDIENNACECGYKRCIKVSIKNNINDDVKTIICKPYEAFEFINTEKEGYKLQYIEDMILENNGYVKAEPDRIDIFPEKYDTNTHIYNLVYSTNKYYLNFNKENNLSLNIDTEMEKQIVLYDEITTIDKNKYLVHGYTFLGWAVKPDLNTVLYADGEEIYNLTNIDEATIQLYPVYSVNHFTIKYTSNRGTMKTKIRTYEYGIEEELEKYDGKTSDDFSYMGWEYRGNILKEKTTKQLEKYIMSDNFTIILSAKFYQYDRNEKTSEDENSKKNETYIFHDNPFFDEDNNYNDEDDSVINEENDGIEENKKEKENDGKSSEDNKQNNDEEDDKEEGEVNDDKIINDLFDDDNEGGINDENIHLDDKKSDENIFYFG